MTVKQLRDALALIAERNDCEVVVWATAVQRPRIRVTKSLRGPRQRTDMTTPLTSGAVGRIILGGEPDLKDNE